MLVFSTRLPLKDDTTPEDCMRLFIKWVIDSPNYDIENIDYDVSCRENFYCDYINQTFSIRHYKDEIMEISACRLENRDNAAIWTNDCIFLNENNVKSLLIQLNCNRIDFNTNMPRPHKPYIVRQFVESGYCKDDAGIPITDKATDIDLKSNDNYYEICVNIMNGNFSNSMPVVYISRDCYGQTVIDPQYLARNLSGIAHVFVEKNKDTALKLREDTDGNNAHNGYIGIYFPGTKNCQKHSLSYYPNYRIMAQEIINSVWKVLVNRLDSFKFNWSNIIISQFRQEMIEWQDISSKNKDQLDTYVNTFDEENKNLRNQIEELNKEIYSLRSQLDTLKVALNNDSEDSYFYKMGAEPNLYPSERSDLLYSILSQVQSKYDSSSRPYALIKSMLEANPVVGECERVISGISTIFNGNARLNSASKSQLKNLGFTIEEDGPHYKLIFHDPRYMFTVSKTPSDHKSGRNLITQIRSAININRKI